MEAGGYIRVVSLRKGRLKVAEFRLRPGEKGLSLFRRVDHPGPPDVIAAVRAAGKQGELAVAVIPVRLLRELGLVVVATSGDTPAPEVNRLHVEARLPSWRSLLLRLRGKPIDEYFNERYSERLAAAARVLA
jgi:hypothetical protein